jgi:formate-dependent nitrite reductase membrane component NrfD
VLARREAGRRTVWDYPLLVGLVMFLTGVGAVLTVLAVTVLNADPVIGGVLTVAVVLIVMGLLLVGAGMAENGDSTKDEGK